MKQKTRDRVYYENGYKDGTEDYQKRNFVPKIVGLWVILFVAAFEPGFAIAILAVYTIFDYQEHRDRKKWHESDPPDVWEED